MSIKYRDILNISIYYDMIDIIRNFLVEILGIWAKIIVKFDKLE